MNGQQKHARVYLVMHFRGGGSHERSCVLVEERRAAGRFSRRRGTRLLRQPRQRVAFSGYTEARTAFLVLAVSVLR